MMLYIFFFIFGTVIGSFLNVVVLRFQVTSIGGRSRCQACNYQLRWYDNIPILSYLLLRGRCRSCGTGLSVQYPLVELTTGVLFALIGILFHHPVSVALAVGVVCSIILLSVYDIRHYQLPTEFIQIFAFFAILSRIWWAVMPLIPEYLGALSDVGVGSIDPLTRVFMGGDFVSMLVGLILAILPVLVVMPLYITWKLSHGRLIGFGDLILVALFGLAVGWWGAVVSVIVACWVGTVAAAIWYIVQWSQKRIRRTKQSFLAMKLPFGPFLLLGFLVVYYTRPYDWIYTAISFFGF